MPPNRYHVFISHNSKDKAKITKLVQGLQRDGFEVWFDIDDIVVGENWEKQVLKELKDSKVCVVFFSEEGWGPHHLAEVKMAQAISDIKIIPVFLPGAPDNKSLNQNFFEQSGLSEKTTYLDFRSQFNIQNALILLQKAILGEGKGLDWSVKLERDARNWANKRQPIYSGRLLKDAEEWGRKNPSEVSEKGWAFISASLAAQSARSRQIIMGLILTVSCITCLALYAFIQRNQAVSKENARATAQANAEEQANSASARLMTVKAQDVFSESPNGPLYSAILGIESLQLYPSLEATQIVQKALNLLPKPIISVQIGSNAFNFDISPNGQLIASTGADGVYIWNAIKRQEVTHINLNKEALFVTFNPDGTLIALGGDDGVTIWSLESNQEIARFHDGESVSAIDFSPDGQRIVSGSQNGIVTIWDIKSGLAINQKNYGDSLDAIAYSPNGCCVISGGRGYINIWDVESGEIFLNASHDNWVPQVTYSSDGNMAAGATANGEIWVWDINTRKEVFKNKMSRGISSFAFSPNGKILVTASLWGEIWIWDINTGQAITKLQHGDTIIWKLKFSENGRWMGSISNDDSIKIWRTDIWQEESRILLDDSADNFEFNLGGTEIITFNKGTMTIWNTVSSQELFVAAPGISIDKVPYISNDGSWVVYPKINSDNYIYLWDTEKSTEKYQVIGNYDAAITRFNKDTGVLSILENSQTICFWDVIKNVKIGCEEFIGATIDFSLSSNGQYGALATNNGNVTIWEISTGKEVFNRAYPDIRTVEFDSTSKYLIMLSGKSAIVWDILSNTEGTRVQHSATITELAIDSTNYFAATGSHDNGEVLLWDIQTGTIFQEFTQNTLTSMDISSDGNLLALTGSNSLYIWDIKSRKELINFTGTYSANSVNFDQNSQWVAFVDGSSAVFLDINTRKKITNIDFPGYVMQVSFSANGDSAIIIDNFHGFGVSQWLWRPEDLITELCARLPRNLTKDEWNNFLSGQLYSATCPNLPIE